MKNQALPDTVSIIGGSGFIGTRLTKRLIRNKSLKIEIIDKSTSKSYGNLVKLVDVRYSDKLKNSISDSSIIINLAAEHRDDVRPLSLYADVNVGGANNICNAARQKNVSKIIFTSTVAVYGFAPIGTDEAGEISPFADYGRTKYEAELIFRAWQSESPSERTLVIIRPTVVFGEQNRGNVYNLLRQISSGKFVMVGNGENRKSLAYVENVAAFIEYAMSFQPGVHVYNYVDKPDFSMNTFIGKVKSILGKSDKIYFRLPLAIGLLIGKVFDLAAALMGTHFSISAIRVKKFCSNSVYNSSIDETGFVPPISLEAALENTVRHEFIEKHDDEPLYFSE